MLCKLRYLPAALQTQSASRGFQRSMQATSSNISTTAMHVTALITTQDCQRAWPRARQPPVSAAVSDDCSCREVQFCPLPPFQSCTASRWPRFSRPPRCLTTTPQIPAAVEFEPQPQFRSPVCVRAIDVDVRGSTQRPPHTEEGSAMPVVDWEQRWSVEARGKQLPSLHGIVSKYTCIPDVIGMHGGLPPADAFPFTSFGGRMCADADGASDCPQQLWLDISEPLLVTQAQQYNMNAKGYAPLVSWARSLVEQLHRPAAGIDVVTTCGSSAALDSLVRMLLDPGDPILLEEFTYAHIVEAHLLPLRAELLPVAMDAEGLVPAELDRLMTARQAAGLALPRVLYTIPTGQNPTGAVMSSRRIQAVYALAQKWDLVVIEDDAYFWLQYPDGPDNVPGLNIRPGFLSLDTDGRVIRLDTLAKLLGPGYRLGWLAGPPELAAKFSLYTAGQSIGANMLSQVFIHQLLQRWGRSGFEAFVSRLQQKYARQAQVAAAAAAEHLAGLAEWQPVRAGMFMWCKLTGGGDSAALLDAAAAEKVMVVPGHLISVVHLQAAFLRKMQAHACQLKHQQQLLQQVQAQLAGAAAGPDTSSSSSCEPGLKQVAVAGQAVGAAAPAAAAAAGQEPSCPYFRVSFVSVGPDDIREGFVRLARAIPNCHSEPKTPPAKDA